MFPRQVVLTVTLLLGSATAAHAQATQLARGPFAEDTVKTLPPATRHPLSLGRTILPSIIAPAQSGSYLVVEVPVPVGLSTVEGARWAIETVRPVTLLSRHDGVLAPGATPHAAHASLLVTLSVPQRARAGLLPAATVRFTEASGRSVEVPVHLMVGTSRNIELTVSEALRGVRPGERFALRYRLTNLGNTTEQVSVRAELPPSWHADFDDARLTPLASHAMVERSVMVTVPPGTATGAAIVRLIATVDGAPVAAAESRITVQRDERAAAAGPLAVITTALGHDADGTTTNGVAVTIDGKITDNVDISARLSHTTGNAVGSYALARAGLYHTRPSIRLTAPDWSLAMGVMGETFTELTGAGLGGEGVSGSVRRGRIKATALLGRSLDHGRDGNGLLAGGTLAVDAGSVILSANATHLNAQGSDPRRLQAVSLRAQMPGLLSGAVAAEVAQRWTARGASPGASVSYDHQSAVGSMSVRAMHAPGGSGAFARASNEVAVAASRSVGALVSVSGSIWASEDRGSSALGNLNALSASFGVARRMSRVVGVSAAVQHNTFTTDGTAAGFGSSQTEGSLALVASGGGVRVRAAALLGEAARSTRFAAQAGVEESGYRRTLEGSIQWTGTRGTIDLSGRLERNDIRSGTLPQQVEVSLRAADVPLTTIAGVRLVAGAEIRRDAWPGFAPARWTTGMQAEAQLPLGFAVAATAEHNPYLQSDVRGGWLYGLRIGRTIGLPRLASGTTRGAVYDDRNGNGVRDPGEPGLANVVVRHLGGTAITDANGRYHFADVTTSLVEIDPASLPMGLVPAPLNRTPGILAVTAMAPLRVELLVATDSLGRGQRVDLGPAVVMARHESGRTWIARKLEPGSAVFDGLPPGHYQLVLDLLDLSEPVEPREVLPAFEVRGGSALAGLTITLHARRISIKQLAPGPTAASAVTP